MQYAERMNESLLRNSQGSAQVQSSLVARRSSLVVLCSASVNGHGDVGLRFRSNLGLLAASREGPPARPPHTDLTGVSPSERPRRQAVEEDRSCRGK
jgi:hypothetical protein